jgi:hypothetical protein
MLGAEQKFVTRQSHGPDVLSDLVLPRRPHTKCERHEDATGPSSPLNGVYRLTAKSGDAHELAFSEAGF